MESLPLSARSGLLNCSKDFNAVSIDRVIQDGGLYV